MQKLIGNKYIFFFEFFSKLILIFEIEIDRIPIENVITVEISNIAESINDWICPLSPIIKKYKNLIEINKPGISNKNEIIEKNL